MALTFNLDAPVQVMLEPGFRRHFPAGFLAQQTSKISANDLRALWVTPGVGSIQLKPLPFYPEYQGQQPQLDDGAVVRVPPGTAGRPSGPLGSNENTWLLDTPSVNQGKIYELLRSQTDPWVGHVRTNPILGGPALTLGATGLLPLLDIIAIRALIDSPAGAPFQSPATDTPGFNMVQIGTTGASFPSNQGFLFKWYEPPAVAKAAPTVYAFVFGQYCALCSPPLLEVFENPNPPLLGPGATTTIESPIWLLRGRAKLFGTPGDTDVNHWDPYGAISQRTVAGEFIGGNHRQLAIIPCARHKVIFQSDTEQYLIVHTRAHPQTLPDGSDWDITRSGPVSVWSSTPIPGMFQVTQVLYPDPHYGPAIPPPPSIQIHLVPPSGKPEDAIIDVVTVPQAPPQIAPGAVTLCLANIVLDYTPSQIPPAAGVRSIVTGDHGGNSQLYAQPLVTPPDCFKADSVLKDDCPPPTSFQTPQQRTYSQRFLLVASSNRRRSPEFYSVEVVADPVFQINPAQGFVLQDQAKAGSAVLHAEVSLGINPGDGRLTVTAWDTAVPTSNFSRGYPLTPFRYRTEIPVRLALGQDITFTGFTERTEIQPLRQDSTENPQSPVEFRFRCNDRWVLLEETYLREQRDWTGIGHIAVVDTILRQCGIDTGPPHPLPLVKGGFYPDGSPVMAGGSLAEYPAGWDGAQASMYNTPLGTPTETPDNLEGRQLAGWKPQLFETGAAYLRRIQQVFSNWLLGFRADGTPFYLPYTYYSTPTVTFHTHANRSVDHGLNFNPSKNQGLNLFVSQGQVTIDGQQYQLGDGFLANLPDNSNLTIYVQVQTGNPPFATLAQNTTNVPPQNSVIVGTVQTTNGQITSSDDTSKSGRQSPGTPIARRPVEYRVIEPSGNVIQVITPFLLDKTANRSNLFIDYASVRNPKAVNFLGRYKWFVLQAQGAFTCSQLNRMARIIFNAARRRRVRVSFDADFVPSLKIGSAFYLEGEGNFRLLEMRCTYTRQGWTIANYVGELIESGFGLPTPATGMGSTTGGDAGFGN